MEQAIPQGLDLALFRSHPFVSSIAGEKKWTVSTSDKMPIDMNYLKEYQRVIGATFAGGNQPLTDLDDMQSIFAGIGEPDQPVIIANAAYNLKQAMDGFFVLDIEPDCPPEMRDQLLALPYVYGEYYMSGRGFHLVFTRPDPIPVKRPELFLAKPAIKHENGWFEFLLNHYVTFTGHMIDHPAGQIIKPEQDLWDLFDAVSEKTQITRTISLEDMEIPDIDDIERGQFIVDFLSDEAVAYRKTPEDFNNDMSKYEFGVAGFYHKRMCSLLSTTAYQRHDYTPQERIRILYEIMVVYLPWRKKHDEYRDNMPWLMYTAKRVVTSVRQEE